MNRTFRRAVSAAHAAAALIVVAGCTGALTGIPVREASLHERPYRRLPGSTGGIYMAVKKTFDRMGIRITGEREPQALVGRIDVGRKRVIVYLRIARGNRVYLTIYNPNRREKEEWRSRLYREILATIEGTPAERQRERPKRG